MFRFQNLRKKSTYYSLHESNIIMNAKIDQYLEEVKTFMLEYLEHSAMKKTFANAVIQTLRTGGGIDFHCSYALRSYWYCCLSSRHFNRKSVKFGDNDDDS